MSADMKATSKILYDIALERTRQDDLKALGKFAFTCADDVPNGDRLTILTEEVGEVARELCDGWKRGLDKVKLRTELIQVAAIAVAWVDGLDKT